MTLNNKVLSLGHKCTFECLLVQKSQVYEFRDMLKKDEVVRRIIPHHAPERLSNICVVHQESSKKPECVKGGQRSGTVWVGLST